MRQKTSSQRETSDSTAFTERELQDFDSESPSQEQHASEIPDPLYDEHADSEDERWVARNMLGIPSNPTTSSRTSKSNVNSATKSVSCPSCFSLLSMQTQPHMRFEGQFRAIFVTNCKIVTSQRLRVGGGQQSDTQIYQPVACARCLTEVGVRDPKGIYYFCNVMY